MSTQTGVIYYQVVLPEATTRAERADRGVAVATAIRANAAKWPDMDPTPVALDTLNTNVAARRTDVKNRVVKAGTALLTALRNLDNGLGTARGVVQKYVNATPADAAITAAAGGMELRKEPDARKAKDMVTQGTVSGTADGHVASPPPGYAVEWEGSNNGGTTWTIDAVTDMADVHFTGLTPGLTHSFRYRLTVRGVVADWSQTFLIVIK